MFEARVWYMHKDGTMHSLNFVAMQELLNKAGLLINESSLVEVEITSGGEGRPKGAKRMTLRQAGKKEHNFFWKTVPLMSTPTSK